MHLEKKVLFLILQIYIRVIDMKMHCFMKIKTFINRFIVLYNLLKYLKRDLLTCVVWMIKNNYILLTTYFLTNFSCDFIDSTEDFIYIH